MECSLIVVFLYFSLVNIHSSKIELQLTKVNGNIQWESIGITLPGNDQMIAVSNKGQYLAQTIQIIV